MTGFVTVIQPKAPGTELGIWKLKFLNGIKGVNGCALGACLTPPPFKEKEQRSTTLDPFHERPAARRAKGLLSPALSSRKGGEGDLLLGGRLAINMALLRSFCRERDGGSIKQLKRGAHVCPQTHTCFSSRFHGKTWKPRTILST